MTGRELTGDCPSPAASTCRVSAEVATGGIKATRCCIVVTIALHLQAAVPEDGGVVWPRRIGKVDGFGMRVELALYKSIVFISP
jgi:hypothetical protein